MALFASLNSNTFGWPALQPHDMIFRSLVWAAFAAIRTTIRALSSSYFRISTQLSRFRVVPAIFGWSMRTDRAGSMYVHPYHLLMPRDQISEGSDRCRLSGEGTNLLLLSQEAGRRC